MKQNIETIANNETVLITALTLLVIGTGVALMHAFMLVA